MTLIAPDPDAPAAPMTTPTRRPPFWGWARLNERSLRDLGEALGVSHMTVFNLMLPWTDPRRAEPSDELKAAIEQLTGGAVPAASGWAAPQPAEVGA